jgi:hypothetical protein
MKTAALLVALLVGAAVVQDPERPKPTDQHKWLQQLVGEWTCTTEMSMGPGQEAARLESTESCRALGETWVIAEGKATFDGQPFASVLTLGYDVQEQAFVGTWIDTMQTHMWVYRGTLNDAKKVLTLEAEGPSCDDPTKTSKFRDAIELVAPDHKRMTSSMLDAEGKWVQFMSADFRRKK